MESGEDRLLTLIHSIPDLVIFKDAEGKWSLANHYATQFLQLDEYGYQGKKTAELTLNNHYYRKTLLDCEGHEELAWTSRTPLSTELSFLQQNGTSRMFDVVLIPLFHEDHQRKGMVLMARDITERIELDHKVQLAAKAFESVGEGIVITDPAGTILFVNQAFTRVTGYQSEEVIGKNPRISKSGRHGPQFYKNMWDSITQTGKWQGEIWNYRKDGLPYIEWLTIQSIRNEKGQPTHYVATFRDISEQENLQKEVMQAGKLQRKLLPPDEESDLITIQSVHKPLLYVSGDLYDYIWLKQDERLFGYVIDVMGHGLTTALQASVLRVLLHQVAWMDLSLHEKMDWINKEASRFFADETFAAVICFEFDFLKQNLTYCSAGINYFLKGKERLEQVIQAYGTYVGLFPDIHYDQHSIPFEPGDTFCFMTDGVFDIPIHSLQVFLNDFTVTFQSLKELIYNKTLVDDASLLSFTIE